MESLYKSFKDYKVARQTNEYGVPALSQASAYLRRSPAVTGQTLLRGNSPVEQEALYFSIVLSGNRKHAQMMAQNPNALWLVAI